MNDRPLIVVHAVATVALLVLLLFNIATPYLGLKWEYSLTMFSNLKTDVSNHLLFPRQTGPGDLEYYLVERLEVDAQPIPRHAEALRRLLERAGHPCVTAGVETKPVHGDLIRYHLARFRDEGVRARIVLLHARTGQRLELDSGAVGPEWLRYSLWSRYPMVLHSYREIHDVVRATARAMRRGEP